MLLNNNEDFSWILSQENQVKLFLVNTILYYIIPLHSAAVHNKCHHRSLCMPPCSYTYSDCRVLHSSVFKIQFVAQNHQRLFRLFLPL